MSKRATAASLEDSEGEADEAYRIEPEDGRLRVSGTLVTNDAARVWPVIESLMATARRKRVKRLDIDISRVDGIDGGVMSLLTETRAMLAARRIACDIIGAKPDHRELLRLYGGEGLPAPRKRRKPEGTIEHVGRATQALLVESRNVIAFIGETVAASFRAMKRPGTVNWREIPALIERTGADAVPIVLLINFLVGFVMGFQSARQLQAYGADIFVADIVGLSVARELAPLMTAIIVCGRSGAAFAAELSTMKVSEEIDALRAMGFSPMRYLVFPRLIALVLVVPVLTLMGIGIGIVGGLVVAATTLDIGPRAFINELETAVHAWDVITGLIKSVAYAGAIGLISCQQGLATSGGAEGVGRSTTKTVVTCLFLLVIIDAFWTVVFRVLQV